MAEKEKNDKRAKADWGPHASSGELQNLDSQVDERPLNLGAGAIPEDSLLNLHVLMHDRARLGKNARLAVAFASKGAPRANTLSSERQFCALEAKSKAAKESQPYPPRGGYRIVPMNEERKGESSPESSSSWSSR